MKPKVSYHFYLGQTFTFTMILIIIRAKIGIGNSLEISVLTNVSTNFQVGLKLGPMKLIPQVI